MRFINNIAFISVLIFSSGCSLNKKVDATASASSSPAPDISSLEITPDDWQVSTSVSGGVESTTKTLKADKLEYIKRSFKVPEVSQISVPESNGYQLYLVQGYKQLEGAAFIQPKVFINTGNGENSILGYRIQPRDADGKSLVEISVPVALVDGLVTSIPNISSSDAVETTSVSLPSNFRISDLVKLQGALSGKDVKTLPVCPTVFRLVYKDREYWAKNPFEGLSTCPVNQFFRIKFRAPDSEMRELLEAAAVRDESVTLLTDFRVNTDIPKLETSVEVTPDSFLLALKQNLQNYSISGKSILQNDGYSVADIEDAVTDSMFSVTQAAGLQARYGAGMVSVVRYLVSNYFSDPFSCSGGGTCRSLLGLSHQLEPVSFSWTESEALSSPLQTQSATALGPVANSSKFIAKPSIDQLNFLRKPLYFKGKAIAEIVTSCTQFQQGGYAFNPGSTDDDKAFFTAYCDAVVDNSPSLNGVAQVSDGYYPLGTNTVVYPGAWLKLDIDDISEFTTAKTRTEADGRVVIESDVEDMLSKDADRTQCVEGQAIACLEYKKKTIPVLDHEGNQTLSAQPCQKGEADCSCTKDDASKPDSAETCLKNAYVFQEVLDYSCKPEDSFDVCPYWRTESSVVDYAIENTCQSVATQDYSTFLCLGGCISHNELQCNETKKTPVMADRQVLNCKEDDPSGTAMRETRCKSPEYKCKTWSNSCTHYSVNESFQIIHEEISPKWRPFAINQGEYPKRFLEDVYLKFVSPNNVVSNCELSKFPREFRGNSVYIKIPSEQNEGNQMCDQPLWSDQNLSPLYFPQVFMKNAISYQEQRLCGRTEYSFLTKQVPMSGNDELVPPQFSYLTEANIGPIKETCRADSSFQVGSDLWFTEVPPVRFTGRVSVLGRVLEAIESSGSNL